jgi:hypothetical protein
VVVVLPPYPDQDKREGTMHSVATQEPETLPFSLPLELTVNDPEVLAELIAKQEGRERDDYALGALRLGVLALRQARGQVDANALRHEGEKLLGDVQAALSGPRTHFNCSRRASRFDPTAGLLRARRGWLRSSGRQP